MSKLDRTERPKRIPITGFRNKLTVQGQEAGFHYSWIRDDFVARAERSGFEYVTHDVVIGDANQTAIGGKISVPGGNGVTLFLMRVLQEYYDGDMKEMQDEVDAKEADMYRSLNSGRDGQYGKAEIDVKSRK